MRPVRVAILAGCLALSLVSLPSGLPAGQPGHLDSPADRKAFRRWFAFLAESRYYARKPLREVSGGETLVRWACRQALVEHDFKWTRTVELPVVPAMPSVGQPELFASCDTPRFVSLDVDLAQPGDLLVYDPASSPFHIMVYIGPSQIVPSPKKWVVYFDGAKIGKLCLDSLRADTSPEWHPDSAVFRGVYRFDILAQPGEVAGLAP